LACRSPNFPLRAFLKGALGRQDAISPGRRGAMRGHPSPSSVTERSSDPSRKILMVEGCREAQAIYEAHGIGCVTAPSRELSKAAGAVGCLTAVLKRDLIEV